MRRALGLVALLAGLGASAGAQAADSQGWEATAYRNYTLNCMGCHGPHGESVDGKIPPLRESLGLFVHTPAGRQFIVRVPGASNSALSDEELAQVTNLLLLRYNRAQLPADFQPYTASEVAALRRPAFSDVKTVRHEVVRALRARGLPASYDY